MSSSYQNLSINDIKHLDKIFDDNFKSFYHFISSYKKKVKAKTLGGTFSNDFSLKHVFIDYPDVFYDFIKLSNSEISKFSLREININQSNIKRTIYDNYNHPIGKFYIRSVFNNPLSYNKLILCILDNHNNDLIHISIFEGSYIHITFNIHNKNYQIYYKFEPIINTNEWISFLIQMTQKLYNYFFTDNILSPPFNYFKHNLNWNNLIKNTPDIRIIIRDRLHLLLSELEKTHYDFYQKPKSTPNSPKTLK